MSDILGVRNGTVDLRTGTLLPVMLPARTKTDWEGIDAPCPVWEQFIDDVCAGSPERIDFMLLMLGYAITGRTTEHKCFLLCGDRGKSTLIRAAAAVLGPLAGHLPAGERRLVHVHDIDRFGAEQLATLGTKVFLDVNYCPDDAGLLQCLTVVKLESSRERDPDLYEKLQAEKSGILAWFVRGAMRFIEAGSLEIPDAVRRDTISYVSARP